MIITQTRFQHSNSCDVIVVYEEDSIVLQKVDNLDEVESVIILSNSEVKRINRNINKNKKLKQKGVTMDQCLNNLNEDYKLCPELKRNADSIRRAVDSCISLKEKPYSIKVKKTVFKIKPLK